MKPKKIICFILSLLFILPCLCLTSCDSASVGDLGGVGGGMSTDETQEAEENKTPYYTAPEKYREIAKSDKVYRSGIYTGYSVIIRAYMEADDGTVIGCNLGEVMLKYPGEAFPVHEDPTCGHDSDRCPTSSSVMSKTALIVETESGLPVIFYFGIYWDTVYSEESGEEKPAKVAEVRGYDVETGEYTTVSKLDMASVDNVILYKGKMYISGHNGYKLGMVDIVTGTSKIIEAEDYYNEYNVLGIADDRLYYMQIFGEEGTEEHPVVKNNCALKSCSLDLDGVRTEYDLGDLGNDYHRGCGVLYYYSYMDGSTAYFPRNCRYAFDPEEYELNVVYSDVDFRVCDIYSLDINNISAGEKLTVRDAYKFAAKNGKLYYTFVDYKEVGEVSSSDIIYSIEEWNDPNRPEKTYTKMFGSTDGGVLYEYDTATGATREVCRDSGYNIVEIYEVTDDGKLIFDGRDYVNFVPADEGNYTSNANVGRKEYCMVDLSTGNITELYSKLFLEDVPEG